METKNFNEMVAYDFSNLNLQQEGNDNCYLSTEPSCDMCEIPDCEAGIDGQPCDDPCDDCDCDCDNE